MPDPTWDLVVVGGGTAGIVGAKTAARLGARVLLVERERTGGDCLWTGCVPSKALLAAAAAAQNARRAGRLGVRVGGVEVDFAAVMAHVKGAIAEIQPIDSPAAIEADGARVILGEARFTGPTTIEVAGRTHVFRRALLATGAAPSLPPIPGLAEAGYLTSETLWDLPELPERLAVVGGGSIGCELGQAFARLGSEVTLLESAARILPREDASAAARVAMALAEDGVDARVGHTVLRVETGSTTTPFAGRTVLDDGSVVSYSHLLVAVGRTPRTHGIGLAEAGVDLDDHGAVRVDRHLRTTNHRVLAAGDLTGHPQYTHVAGVHASLAASNAVLGVRRSVALTALPRVTFTAPEVAAVGVPTDPLPAGLRIVEWSHRLVDRAVADGDTNGTARLAVDRAGRILGATVVGPRAGETIGELTIAVQRRLRTRDLAGVIHAYPTYNDGPWNAAIADVREALQRPVTRTALRALVALARLRRR